MAVTKLVKNAAGRIKTRFVRKKSPAKKQTVDTKRPQAKPLVHRATPYNTPVKSDKLVHKRPPQQWIKSIDPKDSPLNPARSTISLKNSTLNPELVRTNPKFSPLNPNRRGIPPPPLRSRGLHPSSDRNYGDNFPYRETNKPSKSKLTRLTPKPKPKKTTPKKQD